MIAFMALKSPPQKKKEKRKKKEEKKRKKEELVWFLCLMAYQPLWVI